MVLARAYGQFFTVRTAFCKRTLDLISYSYYNLIQKRQAHRRISRGRSMKNYYRILNIRSNATADEIKTAYRNLAKRYHPDANPGDKAAAAKFAEINEANDVLSDSEKRAAYDKQLRLEVLRRQNAVGAGAFSQRRPLSAQAEMQAKLHAQAQAEMQAAIQASVQAQLAGVRDRAYKEGYERGNKDGQAYAAKTLAAQNETYRQKISESARDRSDLEQELFDRDRELNKANEKIRELTVQLEWLKKAASGTDADPLRAPLESSRSRVRELENAIAAIRIKPSDVSSSTTAAVNQKRMQLSDRFRTLNQTLNDLNAEIDSLRALNDRQTRIAENEKLLSTLESRAAQWAKKQKEDMRAARSTLYGALGVLGWATEQEIGQAFDTLSRQYVGKKDAESMRKAQKIKDAYATLADPAKRARYNASIGMTDERIEQERKLARENESVQEEYRSKLATRAFWAHFDELSSLALSGDADAQNALGELYSKGDKVERDFSQAVYWFREATAQRHPAAIHHLGMCYLNGEGVRRNKSIGMGYLRQADNLNAPFADVRNAIRAK